MQRLSGLFKNRFPLEIMEALLWIMAVGFALIFFAVKIISWGPLDTPEQSDFTPYYLGARVSQADADDLYRYRKWPEILGDQSQSPDNLRTTYPYLYVPTFAWALRPLGMLSYQAARRVWFWGGVLALSIAAIGLFYIRRLGIPAMAGLMLWILLPATLDNIYLGQIDTFLTPLVVLGVMSLCTADRWKQFAGGCLISLAGTVKLFPLSLVVLAPWGKRWFYGIGWIAGLMLVVIVGFIALPLSTWADFGQVLDFALPPFPDWPLLHNQSLFGFWHHFAVAATIPLILQGKQVGSLVSHPVISQSLELALSYASVILILVFTAIALRKFYQHRDVVFAWTLVLITTLIVAPLIWWHYAMIAAPMFLGIVKMRPCTSPKWRLLLPLGYLFIVLERAKAIYLQVLPHPAFASLMLFGMLLWWLVFVYHGLRLGKTAASANSAPATAAEFY